jgi:hypothetical protein
LAGCDVSLVALNHARDRARAAAAELELFECDAVRGDLPGRHDVVMCSLFLHHLDDGAAVGFLRKAAAAADRAVLVCDLQRCRAGLWLAQAATRLLTTSPVVHVDGPRSVRAAFTCAEALELTRRAGLQGARVQRKWPFRFLLSWYRREPTPGSV